MSLSLSQNYTAVTTNIPAIFTASGGTSPYLYSILAGGAGGSINSSSGAYTAPLILSVNSTQSYDTIQVTDNVGATATAQILVTSPLGLVADILQNQLGLDSNHIFFWSQKTFQPTDSNMYVILSVLSCKPFGNCIEYNGSGSGLIGTQFISTQATLGIDIISRSIASLYQKEYVLMALKSTYSEQQQEANNFFIGTLPTSLTNLSHVDGAAIPYRFNFSINIMYTVQMSGSIPYMNSFQSPVIDTNP